MYKPIQPYHLLDEDFWEKMSYVETKIPELEEVLDCMWELGYKDGVAETNTSVEIPDGCAEIVVSVHGKAIVWGIFSRSYFGMEFPIGEKYIGLRVKPGVFHEMTGVSTATITDVMTPITDIDASFDLDGFFKLEYEDMKTFLVGYLSELQQKIQTFEWIHLFDALYEQKFYDTTELYDYLNLSPRQIQRLFKKHYGLTPQLVLTIIKFQFCVAKLLSEGSGRNELLALYYDQSKFNNEFKKHLGITPLEFVKLNKKRRMSL